jgi:hypothetical protein
MVAIKPCAVLRFLCLAPAIGCLLSWASPARYQAPISVTGTGFEIKTIQTGGIAFANRHYVWTDVPARFNGWRFTQMKGGHPAEVTIHAAEDCDVYIATAQPPDADWQPVDDGTFAYNDKFRTTMHVFGRHLLAQSTVAVPQRGWAGTLVMAPELSGIAVDAAGPATEVVVRPSVVVTKVHRHHKDPTAREARRIRKAESRVARREAHRSAAVRRSSAGRTYVRPQFRHLPVHGQPGRIRR